MAKNLVFIIIQNILKHIEINIHFVWEQIACGTLSLQHISSPDQINDIFTNLLCSAKFLLNKSKLFISIVCLELKWVGE